MCKVSVLVPIYNVEKYLEKCLASISSQELAEMEVICLNDGSTDASSEIAHKFEKQDSRFRVIDKENSGYGKTMNLGIKLASGEYIGIVESDDFIEKDMFASLLHLADTYKVNVVKSSFWTHTNGYDYYDEALSGIKRDVVLSNEEYLDIYHGNPSIWSGLYKRSFLIKNDIFFLESPGASFQDIAWRVKVFMSAEKVAFTTRAFYHYRRDNAMASVHADGKLLCVLEEYEEARRFLTKRGDWSERGKYLYPYMKWCHYTWNCFERQVRLADRWLFYKILCEEYKRFDSDDLLKHSYWNGDIWYDMQKMLWDSRKYFFDRYISILKTQIFMSGFVPLLNKASKLAIYGAGKVGHEALKIMSVRAVRPVCFVVTHKEGNDDFIDDVPVREVDELLPERSDYVILIATGMISQPEILELLLEKGFSDVVAFLPEVRQVLRV